MAGMRHTRHEKEAGKRPTWMDSSPELKLFFENYAKAPNSVSPPPMAPIILTNDDSPPPAAPILPNLSAVLERERRAPAVVIPTAADSPAAAGRGGGGAENI
jgi:hypothetical protein